MITVITLLSFMILWLTTWTTPEVNLYAERSIHTCIHDDNSKLQLRIDLEPGSHFDISFVENTKSDCLNPYFPSIHIQASQSHDAWVHIVYTDSTALKWRIFIDAEDKDNNNSAYPFYTYEQDFYDAPLWRYSLLTKPISVWKGHVFAVKVDHKNKIIKCIGGIEWGFALSPLRLYPKAIHPKLLGEYAWHQAWIILEKKLSGYKQIYRENGATTLFYS
jgi:hypothetical protein